MVGLLLSWAVLFFVQLFFNLFSIFSLWFRIFFLSSFMLFSTVFWIKWVERNDLRSRLGFNEGGLTVLTYVFLSAIVLFFTQRPFWEAIQLLCLFSVLPLFEEFFFRIHLENSYIIINFETKFSNPNHNTFRTMIWIFITFFFIISAIKSYATNLKINQLNHK